MFTNPEVRGAPRVVVPAGIGWGVALAVGAALISGVAIYLNAFAVKQLPDTALYTTLKNGRRRIDPPGGCAHARWSA